MSSQLHSARNLPSSSSAFKFRMMESSQSTASAQYGLTQNEPHNATEQAPQSENQIEPLELEDTEEEVEHVNNKRPKPGRSFVWDHMVRTKKVVDGKAKFIAICNICKAHVPAHPNKNGTSSCRNHLRQQCKNSPYYMKGSDKGQSILTNEAMVGGTLGYHSFNQKRCEDVLIEFVIRDELPFRAVEGEGFLKYSFELQPRFKVPNRKKVATGVWELFLTEKAKIKSVMEDQRISITTDTWTSIQNINYMVVTAHFLDNECKLHKRIIAFKKITSHKGDDIGRHLDECLNDWGIEKVFSIVVDNATSNDVAVEHMKKRLRSLKTLLLEGKYLHMRCACHILNLIVKDGMKDLASSLEGIRNCVKYIHSSAARLDKFRDFAILERLDKMATVPLDVATRWNSTYKMLDCAYKYRNVFKRMADENAPFVSYFEEKVGDEKTKRVGPPSDDNWDDARSFTHFLKKFYETTLKFSATKATTSDLLFLEISSIQVEIDKKMKDTRDPTLQRVAYSMKKKFEKYWGRYDQVNKLMYVATTLDPRFKLQGIKVGFKNIGWDLHEQDQLCKDVKACLYELYEEYKGEANVESHSLNDIDRMNVDDDVEIDGDDAQSQFLRDLIHERQEQHLLEITNEVDQYLSDPFESVKNPKFNILDWWKCSQSKYPILSKMAKDVFAIPSSTVASESAFSLGKRVVDPFRASLSPKMVEALVCTSDWLRAGGFNFYKEATEEELELYKTCEELEKFDGSTSQARTSIPSASKN